jgi:integrase
LYCNSKYRSLADGADVNGEPTHDPITGTGKMKTRKRRGRGEACIYQRLDGLWSGQVSLGYCANGKRSRKTVYGASKAEVAEKIRKLQMEHDAGRLVAADDLTVSEYLQRWLSIAKDRTGDATYVRYEQLVEMFLIPAVGGMKLSKLRPIHVETCYANMQKKTADGPVPATAATRRAVATVVMIALRHAIKTRILSSNPAEGVSKPKAVYREMAFLTGPQAKTFLDAARPSRNYALFAVAVGSGCRVGELLAMQWSDVDFEKGTVEVRRSVSQTGGKNVIKEPKSRSGRRTITLPVFAVEALREHRKAALAAGLIASPVFCTGVGTILGKSNVRREFAAVVKLANANGVGIPSNIRFHDLRHSHASVLIASGASITAVSRRLGHADITITLKAYAHLMPDDDAKLATLSQASFG